MADRTKAFRWALLTAVACLPAGCNELSLEPAPGPYYGDRLPTQSNSAKSAGANVAPAGAALLMEVLPAETTTLSQTPHILVATVRDANGLPRRNCRVDWKLEGVGEIVAVDGSGAAPNQGRKIDDASAVSYTESTERRVARDGDAGTEFAIHPGQSW